MVIVGGGIAGVLAGANLRKAGIERIRIVDQAGGIGGTWYWNRYPGVMCDVESYIYIPMLEELDYIPTRRYAFGEEIRGHLEAIAERFDLTPDALFHTGVTRAEWDEDDARWLIHTDRGDEISCRWYVLAVGILNLMKLPAIPGMEDFAGRSFHTARWDYEYTGGGPHEPLDRLGGQGRRPHRHRGDRHPVPAAAGRVGQARLRVPAHALGHRRAGQPADRPRLRRAARAGVAAGPDGQLPGDHAGRPVEVDLVDDGWTQHYAAVQHPPRVRGHDQGRVSCAAPRSIDFGIMEEHRRRVDELVDRPGHGRDPQAVVPLPLQAAVLPRRVPAGLQQPQRHPDRLPRRDRADHQGGPGRRREAVRGRLHHLRDRLRGRAHAAVPPRRSRDRRSRRRHPGREVGRRRRQPVRDDEPRLPQHVRHAGAGAAGGGDRQLHPAGRARGRVRGWRRQAARGAGRRRSST